MTARSSVTRAKWASACGIQTQSANVSVAPEPL